MNERETTSRGIAQPVYRLARDVRFACSNVHNMDGAPGGAGEHATVPRLRPGERRILADLEGPAVIARLWLTFEWEDRFHYAESMLRNRCVTLEVTWDNATTPAISVPAGDFFCHPLCYDIPFENAWFADPVGRSSLCFIPMPFRTRATVAVVNDFERPVSIFHDIRFLRGYEPDSNDGYLHACFRRTVPETPGTKHDILPPIRGTGRYLGTHLGIITDPHNPLEWHRSNVAFFLDGDDKHPSMLGASLDDYAGSAWLYEQRFMHRDSGLLLSRDFPEGGGHYGFYFYHRRDPLYFDTACEVSIRPGVPSCASELLPLLRRHPGLAERVAIPHDLSALEKAVDSGEELHFHCGRLDDLSTVALYYLDRPGGDHRLCAPEVRGAPAWKWPMADSESS
jgi:hypothetical protein